jgi:hypothetical protein
VREAVVTERVFSRPIYVLGKASHKSSTFIDNSITFPLHNDRPIFIKHLRIYERARELADPDANTVLADALAIGNRDSVDVVIREIGIAGCWRPSTILVMRMTDYGPNRLIVESATVAHALWNIDLHVPYQRSGQLSLDLYNDEERQRDLLATFHTVEMTDADLRGDSDNFPPMRDVVSRLEHRINQLESAVRSVAAKQRGTAGVPSKGDRRG